MTTNKFISSPSALGDVDHWLFHVSDVSGVSGAGRALNDSRLHARAYRQTPGLALARRIQPGLQRRQHILCLDIDARSAGLGAGRQATRDERFLPLTRRHLAKHGLLGETGHSFAFMRQGLGRSANCGIALAQWLGMRRHRARPRRQTALHTSIPPTQAPWRISPSRVAWLPALAPALGPAPGSVPASEHRALAVGPMTVPLAY